jgi:predicted MFS family arabinose efflux permease
VAVAELAVMGRALFPAIDFRRRLMPQGGTRVNRTVEIKTALGGMLAMAAALGIGRFVYTPVLPAMIDGLQLSKSQAGLIASFNFLGYLAGALASSRSAMAGGRKAWLIGALLASAATTLGMAASTDLLVLSGLRFLGGVASAYVIVTASTLVLGQLAAAGRGDLSAVHFAGVGVGIVASATVVSSLLAAGADWRWLWIVSGVLALGAIAPVALLIQEPGQDGAPAATLANGSKGHGITKLIVAYGLFGFGYVITATFLVTIVRLTPELRLIEAWVWIVFGLAAIPSVAMWSWLGARTGLLTAFAIACIAEAAGVAASVEWISVTGVLVSALLLGGTFMGITALGLVAARQMSGAGAQRMIALMTGSFAMGQIIGPAVAGALYDQFGSFRIPSLIAATALVLAAGIALAAARDGARQARDAAP